MGFRVQGLGFLIPETPKHATTCNFGVFGSAAEKLAAETAKASGICLSASSIQDLSLYIHIYIYIYVCIHVYTYRAEEVFGFFVLRVERFICIRRLNKVCRLKQRDLRA